MAKLTLLEMTQRILSSMDSDEVNSIDDTVEAGQVALIVRESYEDLVSQRNWPFLCSLSNLTGLGDTDNPTKMQIPEDTNEVLWIKYNKKDVSYMEPKAFKDMLDQRSVQAGLIDENGYGLTSDPTYWTTYDDNYIIFDSYDSDEEATLVGSKAVMYGVMVQPWTHEDDFVPNLPEKMFATLVADAKGTAFLQLKQQANAKEETKARRGKARFQSEAKRTAATEHSTAGPNYGRR